MIVVKVRKEEIQVCGHAGYAEIGKDIVCAGVSTLVVNLVNSIHSLTEDDPVFTMESGNFYMEIRNLSERTRTLIDSFFIGVCEIASNYPEYVRII